MSPTIGPKMGLVATAMSALALLAVPATVHATPTVPLDPQCDVLWGDYCYVPGPQAPKQGPTVTANPGLAGVTFHVTDRSGVASQCTYSSEGYTDSFGLAANSSFDLFVPAVRLLKTRTGTISCDNGTSTGTSVFF
jgi:hypothetical protein